ncbi:hypothetical protein CCMA1212_009781 [Trichoderma ghanense]|uniref:Uncharacterized protein n=1 Tax=Trichoderma ghanense TaxID=65468 RepID=A0ABY2GRG2_9HYPO
MRAVDMYQSDAAGDAVRMRLVPPPGVATGGTKIGCRNCNDCEPSLRSKCRRYTGGEIAEPSVMQENVVEVGILQAGGDTKSTSGGSLPERPEPRATSDAGQKQYVQISAAAHGRRPGCPHGAGCLRDGRDVPWHGNSERRRHRLHPSPLQPFGSVGAEPVRHAGSVQAETLWPKRHCILRGPQTRGMHHTGVLSKTVRQEEKDETGYGVVPVPALLEYSILRALRRSTKHQVEAVFGRVIGTALGPKSPMTDRISFRLPASWLG